MILLTRSILFVVLLSASVRAAEPEKPSTEGNKPRKQMAMRLGFNPGAGPWKGEKGFQGASWTKLTKGFDTGALTMHARAGIGDKFPVQEVDGVTLFDVILQNGTDDHLQVLVESDSGTQTFRLPRQKPVAVLVLGTKYTLTFPEVSVAAEPGEKPVSNKATIFVKKLLARD